MGSRLNELLEAVAECFENHSSPFTAEWLSAHGVTLDECGDLSEAIATACRNFARLPAGERMKAIVRSVEPDGRRREHLLAGVEYADNMRRAGGVAERIGRLRVTSKKGRKK